MAIFMPARSSKMHHSMDKALKYNKTYIVRTKYTDSYDLEVRGRLGLFVVVGSHEVDHKPFVVHPLRAYSRGSR